MNTYRIALATDGFQVIETSSDGVCLIGAFPSETDAQTWLDEQMRRLGEAEAESFED